MLQLTINQRPVQCASGMSILASVRARELNFLRYATTHAWRRSGPADCVSSISLGSRVPFPLARRRWPTA